MKSPLENKTIRPGSIGNYSFYYSNRQTAAPVAKPAPSKQRRALRRVVPLLLLIAIAAGAFMMFSSSDDAKTVASTKPATTQTKTTPVTTPARQSPVVAAPVNNCAGNQLPQFVKVSVSQRHMWACNGTTSLYDSSVITGMEAHASTLTPVGTYKIYAKVAGTTLTGSDETGSWKDPVSYWMPFLDNQYGTYGFHDATWRDGSEFGTVDPNSDKASHGCVELPLAASTWLYNWAAVGTTVSIEA